MSSPPPLFSHHLGTPSMQTGGHYSDGGGGGGELVPNLFCEPAYSELSPQMQTLQASSPHTTRHVGTVSVPRIGVADAVVSAPARLPFFLPLAVLRTPPGSKLQRVRSQPRSTSKALPVFSGWILRVADAWPVSLGPFSSLILSLPLAPCLYTDFFSSPSFSLPVPSASASALCARFISGSTTGVLLDSAPCFVCWRTPGRQASTATRRAVNSFRAPFHRVNYPGHQATARRPSSSTSGAVKQQHPRTRPSDAGNAALRILGSQHSPQSLFS